MLAAPRLAAAGRLDRDRDVDGSLRSVQLSAGKQSAEHPVTLRPTRPASRRAAIPAMRSAGGAVTLQLYGQQGVREPDARP